jgi:lipoprotein-releasing system permease protein
VARGCWWAYYAWKQLFPSRGRGIFHTLFSALAVALAVAALTVVLAVMGGFHEKICRQLREAHGAIAVVADGATGEAGTSLADAGMEWELLRSLPGVAAVEPFWELPLLLEHRGRWALAPVRGEGTGEEGNGHGLLLGRLLAEELGARVGDTVRLLEPEALLAGGDELPLPVEADVVRILPAGRGGWGDGGARLPLRELQEIVGGEGHVGGYALRLLRDRDALPLATYLNGGILPPGLHARTWLEAGGELLSMLALEKAALFLSLACAVAMAAFCMASALAMAVVQKTQEIGLLLALGCSRGRIALAFFLQCAGTGAIGLLLGFPLAALILRLRDGLLRCLLAFFGRGEEVLAFYGFRHLPVFISCRDLLAIAGFSLLATGLAGIIPVRRILRLDPSTALRHE